VKIRKQVVNQPELNEFAPTVRGRLNDAVLSMFRLKDL